MGRLGKYLLLRLAEIYRWVTAPKWVSTPYCIYICVYIHRYAHTQKKNHVRPFPRTRQPAEIVTPSLPGHGGCVDPSAIVRPFPPRSSRSPCTGMLAVTILVGHCAPLPANIVTPSLPGHGGCDDPWWPMCTPSCGKRSQSRSSRPCPGMVAVTIPSVGTGLSKGCRDQKSVSVGIGLSKGCRDQKSVSVGTGLPKGCET